MTWQEELKKEVEVMLAEGNISDVASRVIPEYVPYIKLSKVEAFITSLLKKQREICAGVYMQIELESVIVDGKELSPVDHTPSFLNAPEPKKGS